MCLPFDFCAEAYKKVNEDLKNLDDAHATLHYLLNGHKEGRSYKPTDQKHIIISIATYKNREVLEECLDSIERTTTYKNLSIIVTDNAGESDVESLVQRFKVKKLKIEYIKNSTNEYFSKPHNKIISRFKSSDIVLMNDDIVLRTNQWVEILQKSVYESRSVACCGGKAIMPNGTLEEAGSLMLSNGYGVYIGQGDSPNKSFYNKKRSVGYCSGSLLYIRRDAIKKVGNLDESLKPLYYEDTDWQYRAHLLGLEVIYEPECVYLHKGKSTTRNRLNEYASSARSIFLKKFEGYDLEAFNDMSESEAHSLLR